MRHSFATASTPSASTPGGMAAAIVRPVTAPLASSADVQRRRRRRRSGSALRAGSEISAAVADRTSSCKHRSSSNGGTSLPKAGAAGSSSPSLCDLREQRALPRHRLRVRELTRCQPRRRGSPRTPPAAAIAERLRKRRSRLLASAVDEHRRLCAAGFERDAIVVRQEDRRTFARESASARERRVVVPCAPAVPPLPKRAAQRRIHSLLLSMTPRAELHGAVVHVRSRARPRRLALAVKASSNRAGPAASPAAISARPNVSAAATGSTPASADARRESACAVRAGVSAS